MKIYKNQIQVNYNVDLNTCEKIINLNIHNNTNTTRENIKARTKLEVMFCNTLIELSLLRTFSIDSSQR